jgi:biopolymer transport protein ExbD
MNVSSDTGGDVDINLAPIIDCFTVLIIFLLTSATFLSIGLLNTAAALPSGASDAKPPAISIEIALNTKNEAKVIVTGKLKTDHLISAHGTGLDGAEIKRYVEGLQQQYPDTKGLVISADDEVPYSQVIKTFDLVKDKFPSTLLGGFK